MDSLVYYNVLLHERIKRVAIYMFTMEMGGTIVVRDLLGHA